MNNDGEGTNAALPPQNAGIPNPKPRKVFFWSSQ